MEILLQLHHKAHIMVEDSQVQALQLQLKATIMEEVRQVLIQQAVVTQAHPKDLQVAL